MIWSYVPNMVLRSWFCRNAQIFCLHNCTGVVESKQHQPKHVLLQGGGSKRGGSGWPETANFTLLTILYYKIQSVCVIVCRMSMWNRLPNHAHYSDESFAGDSLGLGLGHGLNFIFKKLILRYFWGKIAPDEKITVYITSRSSANHTF